jgi:hypothetical protein
LFPGLVKLEDRVTPAAVLLYPGSNSQTDTPYPDSQPGIVYSGLLTVGRDIQGQPIDFNNDGAPDLLTQPIEYINSGNIEPVVAAIRVMPWLAIDDSGRFTQTKVYSSSTAFSPYTSGANGLAVLDWNLDGAQDFITLAESSGSVTYKIYENDGAGIFRSVQSQQLIQTAAVRFSSNQICMADFNGDSAPDIIVPVGMNKGEFTIYQGETVSGKWTGLFNLATGISIQVGTFSNSRGDSSDGIQPVATDLNGDGKLDIAVKGSDSFANLFINDGSGNFSLTPDLQLATVNGQAAFNILSGDVNKDGKNDLLISNNSRNIGVGVIPKGPITIFLNETPGPTSGNPVFGTPYGVGGSETHYGQMVLGDMNLDGDVDLVASQQSYGGTIFNVLENDGTGQFPTNPQFLGYRKVSCTQSGIALGDWNDDGQLDVALVSGWDGTGFVSNSQMTQSVGVSINGTFGPLGLKPNTLPAAILGQPYSFQLVTTGGDSNLPYNISANPTTNVLPPGLTVSPSGLISGTPTQAGPFQVAFLITQPNGLRGSSFNYLNVTGSQPEVLTISPATLPAFCGLPISSPMWKTVCASCFSIASRSRHPAGSNGLPWPLGWAG